MKKICNHCGEIYKVAVCEKCRKIVPEKRIIHVSNDTHSCYEKKVCPDCFNEPYIKALDKVSKSTTDRIRRIG